MYIRWLNNTISPPLNYFKMKNLSKILLFGIIIVGVGNSCSTTSSVTPQSQAQLLIGSWKEVSYVRTLCTDPLQNETLKACVGAECGTLVITSSTATIKKTGVADIVLNYTVSGNVLTATPSQGDVITFAILGTTLTIVSTQPASGSSANCVGTNVYTKI